jgi:hypothetical protein
MSEYKFFLHFKVDDVTLEIEEPFMFDAFSHTLERKRGGFSVDTKLFAENTDLLFTNSTYSQTTKYEDIDGTVLFNLSHGLKRIIDSYQEYGADGEIELTVYYLDTKLSVCDFDLENIDTDLLSYFKCSFIENNTRSKHKIREDDIMIDVYAEKDLDGRVIQKLVPLKVLLPSKSTFANSKWVKVDIPYFNAGAPNDVATKLAAGSAYKYFNFCKTPVEYGIEDTLSPSAIEFANEFLDTYDGTMKMVDCKTSKKNAKFKITSDVSFKHIQNGRTGFQNRSSLSLILRVSYGTGPNDSNQYLLYNQEFIGTEPRTGIVPPVIDFELPTKLNEGEFITIYWDYSWDSGTIALTTDYAQVENYSHVVFNDCTIEMTAVESSINSVIQGVRWIDILKKSSEIISGLGVDAPRIDVGGEYYDTLICNGGGLRNISNIPFSVKTKDVFEMGKMVAQDYQITEDKILIGEYSDFFSDKLIKTFNVKPDEKFQWNTNKEYRIKTFDYKFKNYEQDRQEQRTLDAIHTEQQILMPNKKTIDVKKVEVTQILDAYKIDSLKRLGIDPETVDSSLADDTDIAMIKITPLANNYVENYIGLLNAVSSVDGVKLYSTLFRWDKIGLGLSSSFSILSGLNTGTYIIAKIESTILTLNKISPIVNTSENTIIEIAYSLEGVNFIAETDERFAEVLGVISKDTYTNLFYSKSRNILKWMPYLATCSMRFQKANLTVSFLKSNQDLSTRLLSESVNLVEKNSIPVLSIAELKRVTDRVFSVSIYLSDPSDIIDIFESMNIRNDDGSIGGYYGFLDNSGNVVYGYPEKLEYIPVENKLEATCLEKYEKFNGVIDLFETDKELYSQYTAFGIYITVYNADGSIFIKEKRFNKIRISGILYTDIALFLNNIEIYFS